jgi:molybdopterin-binding protein
MKNSIFVIRPYKWNGMWVFDDERVGLDKEPFVAGADTMIDTAVALKGIENADKGFLMVFSADPFPSADFDFAWVREDSGGNVYRGQFEIAGEMRISARNILTGKVKSVVHGAVNSEIVVELPGGQEIVSVITKSSADSLDLEPGKEVSAVIKASNVMLAVNE